MELRTKSGKTLKLTPDHEIRRPDECDETWTEVQNLKVGDKIVTNGNPVCKMCGSEENVAYSEKAKFRGYCKKCIYRNLRNNNRRDGKFVDGDGYVRVTGQQEHPRSNKSGQVYEHILVAEKNLQRELNYPDEQVHHINGDKSDNRWENLEVVDYSVHNKRHKTHQNLHNGGRVKFIPETDVVESVTECGEKHVYDVVMESPYHNFVANGIVVHNCGKTIEALGYINSNDNVERVVVVCPASLRINWKNEAEKWLVRDFDIGIVSGTKDEDWPDDSNFIIINYKVLKAHHDRMREQEWDVLIADESHFVKENTAQRTQYLVGKSEWNKEEREYEYEIEPVPAKKRIFLTGTPMPNRPIELWTQVNYLRPDVFSDGDFWDFAERYCNAHNNGYGWDLKGSDHLGELQKRLRANVMIRRLKKDVLSELPPKQRQVIEIPPNGMSGLVQREKDAIQNLEDDLKRLKACVELAKASDDPEDYKNAVEKLREGVAAAFSEISRIRHETALAKVDYVIEHLENTDEPVVVFAHHNDVAEAIANHFGDDSFLVTQKVEKDERQELADRFQDGERRVFVGTIGTCGVGLTLNRASLVVFAELDWVPGNLSQCEDRCHRIGTDSTVVAQHLVLEGSLDAYMAEKIVKKQEVLSQALDNVEKDENTEHIEEPVVPLSCPDDAATSNTGRDEIGKIAENIQSDESETIHRALKILASMDPDRASVKNDSGYNAVDGPIGHSLASESDLSPRQAALGAKIVHKYHRQLSDDINDVVSRVVE